MQSSKIEFVSKFNKIFQTALIFSEDFPSMLSDFISAEFELEAAVIFKVTSSGSFEVLGKSAGAKKSLKRSEILECAHCQKLIDDELSDKLNLQTDCKIVISDIVHNEACSVLQVSPV